MFGSHQSVKKTFLSPWWWAMALPTLIVLVLILRQGDPTAIERLLAGDADVLRISVNTFRSNDVNGEVQDRERLATFMTILRSELTGEQDMRARSIVRNDATVQLVLSDANIVLRLSYSESQGAAKYSLTDGRDTFLRFSDNLRSYNRLLEIVESTLTAP